MYGRDQYQSAATDTAGPAQLVLMLYDSALMRLEIAEEAIDDGRLDTAHTAMIKAQAIVDELNLTLDIERGGRIAENLRDLYLYCSGRLIEANIAKDVTILAEVTTVLQGMRDVWNEACVLSPVAAAG